MDARKRAEMEPLVMIFYSQGTLISKDKVVSVEENTEPYEPIDRGKVCRTEDPEQVPGKPNVFERVFSGSTNCVSETTLLSGSEHQVANRELVFLIQTKLSDGDEEGLPLLKRSDLFPSFRFATDLLVPSEDCTLKTLIIDANTVAYNKGNFPVKLNVGSDVHGIERNIASKGEIEYLHNLSDKMLTCELQGSFDNLTHVSDILMKIEKFWSDNTYLVEKIKNQIVDIWMESLMVDHKLSSPWSLDQPGAMNCTRVVCGYSHIRNASKISVEGHIGLLILHFGGKSYTIRNALVGKLEKLVMKAFNDMEVEISSKAISSLTKQAMLKVLLACDESSMVDCVDFLGVTEERLKYNHIVDTNSLIWWTLFHSCVAGSNVKLGKIAAQRQVGSLGATVFTSKGKEKILCNRLDVPQNSLSPLALFLRYFLMKWSFVMLPKMIAPKQKANATLFSLKVSAFRSHLYQSLDIIFLRGHNLIMSLLNEKQCSYHADWRRKLGQLKHSLKFMKLRNTINVGRHRLSCILRLIVAFSVFNIVSFSWFILHGLGDEKQQNLLMIMKMHGLENGSTFAIFGESNAMEPKHKSSAISIVEKASGKQGSDCDLVMQEFWKLKLKGVRWNSSEFGKTCIMPFMILTLRTRFVLRGRNVADQTMRT
ncbi:hypothetical protein CQW23_09990 [Capsicum baccatum]|uniref:Uncharacterized protein n=1 Tax=Capsicum baccatum TaxID=33114 RepID=A0A2G2WYE3_CAPBA|nr:hypothetical protein CQW23_09990 [Capsicum baccatum]